MKRKVSILIILIMLANSIGGIIAFTLMQKSLRRQMKRYIFHNISEDQLEQITVSYDDISKQKDFRFVEEHEFIYKGKLYDIAKRDSLAAAITFYCVHDKDEQQLIESYCKMDRGPRDKMNSDLRSRISLLLHSLLLCGYLARTPDIIYSPAGIEYYTFDQSAKSIILSPDSPPPRLV